ncbi:hypothetical protein [Rhodoferax ferrireducens]|uniref:hypothetical protein n=1 Tax=Rhodoferax ferrireducens TaxID=192843 RepID=UPI003BB5C679
MSLLGFAFEAGRLDVSTHPFCGGVAEDVRITTRYSEDDFMRSLMGIVHETGHARYEQNLPRERVHLPVGQARSMGIHESQSLSFELQLGRSPQFLALIAPLLQKHLGRQAAFEANNLAALFTRVQPGLTGARRVAGQPISWLSARLVNHSILPMSAGTWNSAIWAPEAASILIRWFLF